MTVPIPLDNSPRFKPGRLYYTDGYDVEVIRIVLFALYEVRPMNYPERRALGMRLERVLDSFLELDGR